MTCAHCIFKDPVKVRVLPSAQNFKKINMSYKLKEAVKVISITHQFSIEDDSGKIYNLRKWENTDIDEGGYYLLDENNKWVDYVPYEEMEDWINEELGGDLI